MLRDLLRRAFVPDEPRYLQSQIELIRRNLPLVMVCSLIASVVVGGEYYALTWKASIFWWSAWIALCSVCGLMMWRGPAVLDEAQLKQVLFRLRLLAFSIGIGWGVMVFVFMQTGDPYTTCLVLSAAAGANAGGMMLFAPVWPLSIMFVLLTAPPAAVVLLWNWTFHLDVIMGSASALYTVFMAAYSYQSARAVRDSIDLRFENDELVGLLRDQSQRALHARQVAEDALREAEEANHAKVIFLASASHDLRQPLHALGLFANALSRTNLTARQQSLLAQIDASGDAARDMLGTLLDFSKVDAGVITPKMQPFALQPMLHRLEQEFAPQATELGLVYRTHDTLSVVHADASLVERIVRNFISNALRYTEKGGILVGVRRRAGKAVVEVWDSGMGIPADQHKAVFREFHQLGNPERDRRKGLGLGLAIVDGLARAMNVDIGLASTPGRGSVFRLSLPLSQEAVMALAPVAATVTDLTGTRVLVIDDDETVRAAMAELLTSWGAWCEVVESADEAVAMLQRFTPQVVVADYRLRSHRNGHEAIELVRSHVRCHVPAVLVTGDTAADRIREAQSTGVTLLHKPVPAGQLYQVLSELLARDAEAESTAAAGAAPDGGGPQADLFVTPPKLDQADDGPASAAG